jgi:hypothetical protein
MATPQDIGKNLVFGKITDRLYHPLANLLVQAYDRDMRSEELLGEAVTDEKGKYRINWSQAQLRDTGKKSADLLLKVLTKEKKQLLYAMDVDAVRFNASAREEINLVIDAAGQPQGVEYDFILKQVGALAKTVAVKDLQETGQNRDVTFLAKETRIPSDKIEHLIVAQRLGVASKIDAGFFYALLRKGSLLKNDWSTAFHVRWSIGIDTEITPLLYDASLTDPKVIQQDTAEAAKEMIVSDKVAAQWQQNVKQLERYKTDAEKYFQNERPQQVLNLISRFVQDDKLTEIGKLLRENKNDLAGFIQKATAGSFFESTAAAGKAKTTLDLGQLLGFDDTIISQVQQQQKIKKPEDIKKLAALNKAGWQEVLSKSADKLSLAGKPIDKKMIDYHASSLARKMERLFPTAAFSAQLGRETKSALVNHQAMADFFAKHEDFDLQKNNVDLYWKQNKLAAGKDQAVHNELKTVQRIFKLVPQYNKTQALLRQNIRSARQIVAAGKGRFLKEIAPKAGMTAGETADVYARAERTSTAAALIVGEMQDTIRSMNLPAMKMESLAMKLEAVSADFPDLQSLFKMTDTCACEECRSVYGPAAYLVEIMQFLANRSVTDLTMTPPSTGRLAKEVLIGRRPDLGDIDLSCANAMTPVPYIDLVCELLEQAVAPDPGIPYSGVLSDGADPLTGKISAALLSALKAAGLPVTDQAQVYPTETTAASSADLPHYLRDKEAVCKIISGGGSNYTVYQLRQTLATAEELAAAPEYVNSQAYVNLRDSDWAFKLPFDLSHTEARAYFSRFDIARDKLMADFQVAGSPADAAIAAEKLGLTDSERSLIVTPDGPHQQKYWNTASSTASDELKVVDTFLTKTGLSYEGLTVLLSLKFINPDKTLFIKHLDLSCDTTQKEIAALDDNALDRIHRFLRWQKKTGWQLDVLDEIISQSGLGQGHLDDACLQKAADLQRLSEATGIPLSDAVGFYGEMPHQPLTDDSPAPLYQQVFLNKAKNGYIDDGLLPEKVDGSTPLADHKVSLSVCLQISQQDLDLLLPTPAGGNLTFAGLSYLFLAARLMKKLKIKASDFIILLELTGISIQDSPSNTLAFAMAVEEAKNYPLKPADVQWQLRHEAPQLADMELKDDKITQSLQILQADLQKAFTDNLSPFNPALTADEQKEGMQTLLSKLPGLADGDIKNFIKFIDLDWTSANDAKTFVGDKLSGLFPVADIQNKIDALAAAPGPDISNERRDLVKAFDDAAAAYLLAAAKQAVLRQDLAAGFKADEDLMNVVLKYAVLKQPAPGTDMIRDILQRDALIDTDTSHPSPVLPAVTAIAFPQHYQAFRLMHKLLPLIGSFRLDNPGVEWLFKNSRDLGWFEWDAIPYQAGQNPVDYPKYTGFADMISLAGTLTPVADPADPENPVTFQTVMEMCLPSSTAVRADFIEKISLLTGYDKTNTDDTDAYLFPAFSLSTYRDIAAWKKMMTGLEYLRKLRAPVAQVKEWLKPVLLDTDAEMLRMALKSVYDEDTWLGTLKEIMDAIRPQKRDALVAYLLASNPGIKDENDLYDHFLVDVDMEACMPSSRIVQAHGTVQLFVQRSLMGLEPQAAADTANDPAWDQWKWMKNYRLWEANRKIFLYPENWLEEELRDDKSFLFTDLENELLQNEVNEVNAEQALIRYLEKLDSIAFLEVMASWYQVDIKTMHVFARTKGGDPAKYFYRRFEQERYWTPWEKVDLEITGDHLLAFMHNNRLNLAWPAFSDEADPNPQSTVPDSAPGTVVDNDKPKRKLKIQLAISEYANQQWQPKKVSKDAIETPPDSYTDGDIPRDNFKFFYNEFAEQILVFNTIKQLIYINEFDTEWQDQEILAGAFDITGCKGYPELAPAKPFTLDFIPKFIDTQLLDQRYREMGLDASDDLSVKNVHAFLTAKPVDEILKLTPGTFRLTYPHQFTQIDLVAFILELLHAFLSGKASDIRRIKIPLGTLLPYFEEDSIHAYVIVPGFYKTEAGASPGETQLVRRTASDVLKLIEDIEALLVEIAGYQASPSPDKLTQITDDFQDIVKEIQDYSGMKYGEQFRNMYHPLVCALRKTLYKDGIAALMKRDTQMQTGPFDFNSYYQPDAIVPLPLPVEDIDFSSDGSYSDYNWELFFHIPLLLATRLSQNQNFEEALTWFHYMFNPTGALPGTVPQKFWVTKPFYLTQDSDYINQRIDTLLYKIADPSTPEISDLEAAVDEWRNNPFQPFAVARFRPVAYQKALLMKYIDNLTEWGDYLFRQDTMESIVQATQMYIMADKLLGPKPRVIPPVVKVPDETYNQLEAKLDSFGNALVELENILPDLSALPEGGAELPPGPVTLSMLYFCIPANDNMLEYWDRIADRLFKIRNCQNIDGIERTLALFAPPIDPGMLVRAAAAGLDISSILAGINAPAPYYRFHVLTQKATELAQEVRNLGIALLQALEKKDAEALALLRNELEIKMLTAVKDMKDQQVQEAKGQIETLNKTRAVTEERYTYYANIEKISSKEQLNLDKLDQTVGWQTAANSTYALGAGLALIPDFALGASGFGGSPHGTARFGGSLLAHSTDAIGKTLTIVSTITSFEANRASITGGYDRRYDDWKLQERLAKKELDQIDQQIAVAKIRQQIAETDLKNQELQIENSKKTDEFMKSKYTNVQLYNWMIGQITSVYFQAYQLAHDFAKKAERSYRFELGNDDSFIQYGYWDSLKKGLQSADKLIYDIKRMETSYYDKNRREYELTRHISLSLLDPLALVSLRASGSCDFDVPEALFDLDHPGHYFRRIKSVGITLPCIAGPYTSVSAKLSLVSNKYRKNPSPADPYAEDTGNDGRFVYNVGAIQSIAASTSQNDTGLFELNFHDERYLPFEGTGAVSSWRLELPKEVRQFDYNTIADVILHMKYTAREGGSTLQSFAVSSVKDRLADIKQQLSQTGLHIAVNVKRDMPNEWLLLKKNSTIGLTVDKTRLPYMAQTLSAAVENVMFIAGVKGNPASFSLDIDGSTLGLSRVDEWQLCRGISSAITLDTLFNLSVNPSQIDNLEDLMLVVKYSF